MINFWPDGTIDWENRVIDLMGEDSRAADCVYHVVMDDDFGTCFFDGNLYVIHGDKVVWSDLICVYIPSSDFTDEEVMDAVAAGIDEAMAEMPSGLYDEVMRPNDWGW